MNGLRKEELFQLFNPSNLSNLSTPSNPSSFSNEKSLLAEALSDKYY
jgi:hypothetical protein